MWSNFTYVKSFSIQTNAKWRKEKVLAVRAVKFGQDSSKAYLEKTSSQPTPVAQLVEAEISGAYHMILDSILNGH